MTDNTNTGPESGGHRYLYISVILASFGGFLFGCDNCVISGAILYIMQQFSLSSGMEEIVISSLFLSAMVGAAAGALSDSIGRKKVLITAGILFFAGSLVMSLAPGIYILIAGRVITGLGLGVVSINSRSYISEISTARTRGKMVSFNVLAIAIGTLSAYMIDYFFSLSSAWRWMFVFEMLPASILAIGMLFLCESPRWLALH